MAEAGTAAGEDAGDGVSNRISGGVFFHAVIQGRDITVQLPPQISPATAGLPAPSATFAGRAESVARLLEDLAPTAGRAGVRRPPPVTSLAGLAGIGKTELAVQVAAQAVARPGWFPGGVLFTDLLGYAPEPEQRTSPERALEGLLRALGVPGEHIPNGLQDRQRLYRSVLAAYAAEGRRVLVVIDNVASSGQARPMLPTDGVNAVLITSRHTLDGLDARLRDLDALDGASSIGLLDQELRHARGEGDTRFMDDPASTRRIAELCAGLPLALHIAAALLSVAPMRSAKALADALQDEHTRLDELSRPDRAVRAAFDLSYELLDEDHARMFRLLPLNPGPDLATEAASQLAATEAARAEKLLQHLAEAHLIDPGPTWGRWRMHDLVRLYADDRGRTRAVDDRRQDAQARLYAYYSDTTSAADSHLAPPSVSRAPRFQDRGQALSWLDAERPNLIATAIATAALGHTATATSLTFALADYLNYRHYSDDLITLANSALVISRRAADRYGEFRALAHLGLALEQARRFDDAIDVHTQAADIARAWGDRRAEGSALNNLGRALREVRRFDEAIDAFTQDLAICRDLGDRHGEGTTLNNLGPVLREAGRFQEAIEAHTQAAAISRAFGDRHGEAMALNNLGTALSEAGRIEEGIDAHTHAVSAFHDLDDRHGEAMALGNLGSCLREAGRIEEAVDAHTKDLALCRALGDRYSVGRALTNLGPALEMAGRFEEAIDTATEAAAIFRELGDRYTEGAALHNLALALQQVGRFEEAIDADAKAVAISREFGERRRMGLALHTLAATLREVGRFGEAVDADTEAVGIFHELGDRHAAGAVLGDLAATLWKARRLGEAIDAGAEAVRIFRELGDRRAEATMLLGTLAVLFREGSRLGEAGAAYTRAADIFRELGDRHNESVALYGLGTMLQEAGRFEESIPAHTRVMTISRELGHRHSEGAQLNSIGTALVRVDRYAEANDAFTRAAAIFHELDERRDEATAVNNSAATLIQVGRRAEAIGLLTRAAALLHDLNADDEPMAIGNLGSLLQQVQRDREAIDATQLAQAYEQLLIGCRRLWGEDHQNVLGAWWGFANSRGEAGDVDGAVATFAELLEHLSRRLGADHPSVQAVARHHAHWRGKLSGGG
ncbi:tetratricopeptide repeat protein [Streptomyces sp. T-3]|nr:tetratricopeptide repeat protein [Streptomyces sp. T-3]